MECECDGPEIRPFDRSPRAIAKAIQTLVAERITHLQDHNLTLLNVSEDWDYRDVLSLIRRECRVITDLTKLF